MIAGHSPAIWVIFAAAIAALLLIDIALIARNPTPSVGQSARWSAVVVATAAVFGVVLGGMESRSHAVLFYTGYIVEFSLSVDNLLVFLIVLRYFAVPADCQPRVLKWGVLGAIVMRAIVIGAGAVVLREFHWVIYLFGLLLIVTAVRIFREDDAAAAPDLDSNRVVQWLRRFLPLTERFSGDAFFVRVNGALRGTPLLLVLLVVEWTDLVFAGDSIPAIFAITRDPFLVYTSNIFAVVGLRALFFVLAALLARLAYLRYGVALVLLLVGLKMVIERWIVVPAGISLAAIVAILVGSALVSLRHAPMTTDR